MNHESLFEKRAIDLTGRELAKMVAAEFFELGYIQSQQPSYTHKGIIGIMEIFQCSKSKAMRIRASGIIDEACVQNGKSFLVDRDYALQLMKEKGSNSYIKRNGL